MKAKKVLLTVAVACLFMIVGVQKTLAQNVQVGILLPYSGNYNNWTLTFTNESTYEVFYFETDDSNFTSQVLGSLPAGTYTIEFNSGYFPAGFDFGVCGDNYYKFTARNDAFTWYHAVIDSSTYIQIDEGY
ncbi:hypothetical protein [Pedobacter sp. SYSU D00535]|uniref:hypothetical protein n=1 Tax=Pedobacter sp. SYSU D00535 TaxID=2810308 RepID=UPI001A967A58|nr:hypothetical protein [Pedobacter sp. SYSU D00535]